MISIQLLLIIKLNDVLENVVYVKATKKGLFATGFFGLRALVFHGSGGCVIHLCGWFFEEYAQEAMHKVTPHSCANSNRIILPPADNKEFIPLPEDNS